MVNTELKRVAAAGGQYRLMEYSFVQLMFLRWWCLVSGWSVLLILDRSVVRYQQMNNIDITECCVRVEDYSLSGLGVWLYVGDSLLSPVHVVHLWSRATSHDWWSGIKPQTDIDGDAPWWRVLNNEKNQLTAWDLITWVHITMPFSYD